MTNRRSLYSTFGEKTPLWISKDATPVSGAEMTPVPPKTLRAPICRPRACLLNRSRNEPPPRRRARACGRAHSRAWCAIVDRAYPRAKHAQSIVSPLCGAITRRWRSRGRLRTQSQRAAIRPVAARLRIVRLASQASCRRRVQHPARTVRRGARQIPIR